MSFRQVYKWNWDYDRQYEEESPILAEKVQNMQIKPIWRVQKTSKRTVGWLGAFKQFSY